MDLRFFRKRIRMTASAAAGVLALSAPAGALAAAQEETETEPVLTMVEAFTLEKLQASEEVMRAELGVSQSALIPLMQEAPQESDPVRLATLESYHYLPVYHPPMPAPTITLLQKRLLSQTALYAGTWSVYVKNLRTGEELSVRPRSMKSASTMKLFIMGTVYKEIDKGNLTRSSEIVTMITDMISHSSNSAANRALLLLGDGSYADGIAKVNAFLDEEGYSPLTHEFNGFEDSAAVCDPDHNNRVLPSDCARFLEKVYRREFISRAVCNEIESLLFNQQTRYKIPRGVPEGVQVANKTGEMDAVENDAALVCAPRADYLICVFTDGWTDKEEALHNIQDVSRTVYDFFNDPAYYGGEATVLQQLFAAEREETAILDHAREEQEARLAAEALALAAAMAEEAETETEDPAAGLALPFLDLLAAAEAETETELLPEEEAVPRLQAESGPAEGTSDTGEASSGTAEGIGEAAGITLPLTGGRSTQP